MNKLALRREAKQFSYQKFCGGPGPAARGAYENHSASDSSEPYHHSSFITHHSKSRPLVAEGNFKKAKLEENRMTTLFKKYQHYLLAMLFFVSVVVLFVAITANGGRNFYLISDEATLETRVINAARNVQYLGPYSRFGWNHPGPVLFYMLLPFYALFSMGTQSLYVGATFINLLALFTILYHLYKSNDNYFFYIMAFLLSLYIAYYLGFNAISTIWNPYVTILPLGAIIFMSGNLSLGNLKVLPWQALFATFVIQTHVAYVPVVLAIIGASLVLCGHAKWREYKAGSPVHSKIGAARFLINKETRKIIVVTIVVLLVLWLLPLLEMIKNPPGNLVKLGYYFMSTSASHSLKESLTVVANVTSAPLIKFLSLFYPGLTVTAPIGLHILFFLQLVFIAVAGIINHRQGKKYQVHLLVFGIIGLIVSIYSVTKITGEIYSYLTRWMSIIGFINWGVTGITFIRVIGRLLTSLEIAAKSIARYKARWVKISITQKKIITVALVMLVSLGLLLHQWEAVHKASAIKPNAARYEYIGEISTAIKSYVEKENISSFLMKPQDSLWPIEAGVVNQLYKSSVKFSLEDNWLFWFGTQFKQQKAEKDIIFFKKEKEPPQDSPAGRYLIYHTGECSVYHIQRY